MITIQKLILFLSLIILSFSAESEEEFDKRIEEEPRLIGITKGIKDKTKQTVGLIFQNSKLSPKGFQSMRLSEKENNTQYIIPLKCMEKMPYAKNIMGVFCDIDLSHSNIIHGIYIVENIKYKDMYFLDEVTHIEILKSDKLEFLGIQETIQYYSSIFFFFNYKDLVKPNLIKSLKFTDGREEHEISFSYCSNDNPDYDYVWCNIKTGIKDLKVNKYEVKYITYDNEKMEPKDHIYFYIITEEVILKSFPNSIPKKKDLKLHLEFNVKFTEPINFYFIEINHSYIIYKIHVHPQGDWEKKEYTNAYDYIYSFKKNFIFDTENIPSGKYKVEWVFENIRKEGNFITEVKNE